MGVVKLSIFMPETEEFSEGPMVTVVCTRLGQLNQTEA